VLQVELEIVYDQLLLLLNIQDLFDLNNQRIYILILIFMGYIYHRENFLHQYNYHQANQVF
jgi:hypothetical protein